MNISKEFLVSYVFTNKTTGATGFGSMSLVQDKLEPITNKVLMESLDYIKRNTADFKCQNVELVALGWNRFESID